MKISAFTIVRNAEKLYFPIKESILSILPIVNEYIIALGKGDVDDNTKAIIQSIDSPKIKIYDRIWSEDSYDKSRILAEETNYALSRCTGDWCFYLQADEVIHEKDLDRIYTACNEHIGEKKIQGLLFNYYHFWGDYNHYLPFHGWYKNEIRIIKNKIGIQSVKDAQSFRSHSGSKLTVKAVNAHIYHYGWVRPPAVMQSKKKIHDGLHRGIEQAEKEYQGKPLYYDYGPLGKIPEFKKQHPEVMHDRIGDIFWQDQLNHTKNWTPTRSLHKHEKWRYRIISKIENALLNGKEIFGYSNWHLE